MIHYFRRFHMGRTNASGQLRRPDIDAFLSEITGLIHVGANSGQERQQYAKHDLDVLWIEPHPTVFQELERNIAPFRKQRAIQSLITDSDDLTHEFHVSSNSGASSSILKFKHHKDIWPQVYFTGTITLTSVTLDTLLSRHNIDPHLYQALVLDTQGSELLVLRGAKRLIPSLRYIKTEVSDFEAYADCCQLVDIRCFMSAHGFYEKHLRNCVSRSQGGSYYNALYQRRCSLSSFLKRVLASYTNSILKRPTL
jgi:FkbM family methyltransferase